MQIARLRDKISRMMKALTFRRFAAAAALSAVAAACPLHAQAVPDTQIAPEPSAADSLQAGARPDSAFTARTLLVALVNLMIL